MNNHNQHGGRPSNMNQESRIKGSEHSGKGAKTKPERTNLSDIDKKKNEKPSRK